MRQSRGTNVVHGAGWINPLRTRSDAAREQGQIIVLFALSLIMILVFAAVVVDLGVLRNNKQILVNTMDAAALAGGTTLPVHGAAEGAATNALIKQTVAANYPSLTSSDYTIQYKCLIGVDAAGNPRISDVPLVCDPTKSLGRPVVASDFKGAGPTRYAACDPSAGDVCNTVDVTGSAITQYGFGPVVGVDSGSTGSIEAAACNGPCGAAPATPVDVVLVMDRTASMSAADIADIQSGANTVLSVFNPALQRLALGTIGPSQVNGSLAPAKAACPSGSTSPLKSKSNPLNQVYGVGQSPQSDVNYFGVPTDIGRWIPVGFTSTDGAAPLVTSGWGFNEAYSVNGVTNQNSTVWKAISCLYSYTYGTNLDTPMAEAMKYLQTYGRPGVKKGIIFETDGAPQAGDGSAHYTCQSASTTAAGAKAAGIEVFTIGFGIGSVRCPRNPSKPSCSGSTGNNSYESATWSCQPVSNLLSNMASPDQPGQQHFFDAPDSAALVAAFKQAAVTLAGTGPQLIQLYPPPIVTSVSPGSATVGTTITINGKYFSGATSVAFGSTGAAALSITDTAITAKVPAGPSGATVDVTVRTPGGSSPVVAADHFTYP
jgi:hypothetical protein